MPAVYTAGIFYGGLQMSRIRSIVLLALFLLLVFIPVSANAAPGVRICVFNFSTLNIESAGYGTTVTNMLANELASTTSIEIIERKELEGFLELNDLQQDSDFRNVINVGNRLGLFAIVTGSVAKKGSIITIKCSVVQIDRKKMILNARLKSIGQRGMASEINKLTVLITKVLTGSLNQLVDSGKQGFKGPVKISARSSGKSRIYLKWENPADTDAAGYKIFRSASKTGPFARIAQVHKAEYLDEYLETRTAYYYKIRAYDSKGRQSGFSEIVSAETAPTPNPPIILSTDPHVRSVEIIWAPSPAMSQNTNRLKGYKIYRARVEEGPYNQVATIHLKDTGRVKQSTTTLGKLLKLSFVNKDLTDGEDYYYKITAYDTKDLESDFSTPVKGSTIPVVRDVAATGDMIREIELVFREAESPYIKGYYVYRSSDRTTGFDKIKKINKNSTKKTKQVKFTDDKELGDKTTYYYHITAFDDKDVETSPSETVFAITRGKPPVVGGLQAKPAMVKKVELTWQANEEDEIKGYKMYRSVDISGTYSPVKAMSGVGKNRFVDTGLDDNTRYCYRITSYNKVDVESATSDAVCATTKPRPVKPEGLEGVELQVKKVTLKWPPNPEKDIVLYRVYSSSDYGKRFSAIAKLKQITDYVDKKLKDGQEYQYKIMAEDKDGLQSDHSEIITVMTKSVPKSPEGLTINSEGVLIWTPNIEADIDHYIIYEKALFGITKEVSTAQTTMVSLPDMATGKKKTYVITAVDKDGLESEPSQPVETPTQ